MSSEPRWSNRKTKLKTSEELELLQWPVLWNEENCLQLIDLFRKKSELWDPENPYYTNRSKKHALWKDISSHFLRRADEVKLKFQSLRRTQILRRKMQRIRYLLLWLFYFNLTKYLYSFCPKFLVIDRFFIRIEWEI